MTTRPCFELDEETFHDFFLVKFYDERAKQFHSTAMYPGVDLDRQYIANILGECTAITFNGIGYDIPLLTFAMHGATNEFLKGINDRIIVGKTPYWDLYREYGIDPPEYMDHIDLMEVAPGVRIGLKMYMGRLHAPKMQDLPFDPDERPDAMKRFVLNDYCSNDLIGTNLLRHEIWDRIELRIAMSEKYGIDLRSKSDAQIAEAVIKAELAFKPEKRFIGHGYEFMYQPPNYIKFATPAMQQLHDMLASTPFTVTDKEEAHALGIDEVVRTGVQIPAALKGTDINIGAATYRIGIGGLHSQETCVNYHTDEHHVLMDIDVKSYYPSMILGMDMYPQQLGRGFIDIYRSVYTTRLTAKEEASKLYDLGFLGDAAEQQTISDGLKIVLNGTFGKLFSKYSILYAPEFGIRTTITGQLALLMLIEMMEMTGIQVISANTDGIVLRIPRALIGLARSNVKWWEAATGLEMEETHYRSIYSRDVNNYIAITDKGKVKRKGVFNQGGVLSGPSGKGPDKDICADAVVAYLKDGVPLECTIRGCTDIRKFICVRAVKGGGVDLPEGVAIADGKYLGKAVRWYYGMRRGYIGYMGTGNKVAGSDGATPLMELPASLPADINHQHYEAIARDMLVDLGVVVK